MRRRRDLVGFLCIRALLLGGISRIPGGKAGFAYNFDDSERSRAQIGRLLHCVWSIRALCAGSTEFVLKGRLGSVCRMICRQPTIGMDLMKRTSGLFFILMHLIFRYGSSGAHFFMGEGL